MCRVFFNIIFGPIWRKFTIENGYKILLSVYELREKRCSGHTLLKAYIAFFLHFPQILAFLRDIWYNRYACNSVEGLWVFLNRFGEDLRFLWAQMKLFVTFMSV